MYLFRSPAKFTVGFITTMFVAWLGLSIAHAEEDVTEIVAAEINAKYQSHKENFL